MGDLSRFRSVAFEKIPHSRRVLTMQKTNILSNTSGGFIIFVDQKQPPDKTNVPYTRMKRGHPCVSPPFYANNIMRIVTNSNLSAWEPRLKQFSGSLLSSGIFQGEVSDLDVVWEPETSVYTTTRSFPTGFMSLKAILHNQNLISAVPTRLPMTARWTSTCQWQISSVILNDVVLSKKLMQNMCKRKTNVDENVSNFTVNISPADVLALLGTRSCVDTVTVTTIPELRTCTYENSTWRAKWF